MTLPDPGCSTVDQLAPAYAVGALEPSEEVAIGRHLATCDREHREARDLAEAGAVLAAAVEPVAPSPALRERILATVATTAQEPRPIARPIVRRERRTWLTAMPAAIAAAAVALAIGMGAWATSLNSQLAERDAVLRAVAGADAAYRASGAAGEGWVVESGGEAMFMAEELAALPEDHIYELWLIHEDGTAVAVGTLTTSGGVAVTTLESALTGAVAFAVTVEPHRVEAPTTDPVLIAELGA
jgi:anti-sigma-K factor RskA